MRSSTSSVFIGVACAAVLVTGAAAQTMRINGAGATFPNPI